MYTLDILAVLGELPLVPAAFDCPITIQKATSLLLTVPKVAPSTIVVCVGVICFS